MSSEGVQAVIGKAVTDSRFREALFANADKALAGYDLTEDEIGALKSLDAEAVESLAGSLDERISKAFIIGWTLGAGAGRGKGPRRVPKGSKGKPVRLSGPKEGW